MEMHTHNNIAALCVQIEICAIRFRANLIVPRVVSRAQRVPLLRLQVPAVLSRAINNNEPDNRQIPRSRIPVTVRRDYYASFAHSMPLKVHAADGANSMQRLFACPNRNRDIAGLIELLYRADVARSPARVR